MSNIEEELEESLRSLEVEFVELQLDNNGLKSKLESLAEKNQKVSCAEGSLRLR